MKQTISNYAWTVILIIIITMMIIIASPMSEYISSGIRVSVRNLTLAISARFNAGYEEVVQKGDWTYEIAGYTAKADEKYLKMTLEEYIDTYVDEGKKETIKTNTPVEELTKKIVPVITLIEYTGRENHLIIPNIYINDDDQYFIVQDVGKRYQDLKGNSTSEEDLEDDSISEEGLEDDSISEEGLEYDSFSEENYYNPDNTKNNIFGSNEKYGLASVIVSKGVSINDFAFHNCPKLKDVVITSSFSIGNLAFSTCPQLESVSIGEGTGSIGKYAFANCESLKEVILADSLSLIDDFAFYNCTSMTLSSYPNDLTYIGDSAFAKCSSIKTANLQNTKLDCIGYSAFDSCTGIVGDIYLPDCVTGIGNKAFYNCSNAQSLHLPSGVKIIGESAFEECSGLLSSNFKNMKALECIGNRAFYNCSQLKTVFVFPNTLQYIGDKAFYRCCKGQGIFLNEGLIGVGKETFYYAKEFFSQFILPSTCTSLAGNVVIQKDSNNNKMSYEYMPGSSSRGFTVTNTLPFIVADKNPVFMSVSGKVGIFIKNADGSQGMLVST